MSSPKFKAMRNLVLAVLVSIGAAFSAVPSVAAEYPPTIQAPVVGEPIIAPVPALKKVDAVVIPKATSDSIPTLNISIGSRPALLEAQRLTSPIPTQVRSVTSTLILNGVSRSKISQTPLASISSRKSAEIQLASDVPTRISITQLPKNVTTGITVVSGRKSIPLGSVRIDSRGNLTLPPLTFVDSGKSVTISFVVRGNKYTYTLRSTK